PNREVVAGNGERGRERSQAERDEAHRRGDRIEFGRRLGYAQPGQKQARRQNAEPEDHDDALLQEKVAADAVDERQALAGASRAAERADERVVEKRLRGAVAGEIEEKAERRDARGEREGERRATAPPGALGRAQQNDDER